MKRILSLVLGLVLGMVLLPAVGLANTPTPADRGATAPIEGETRVGGKNRSAASIFYVQANELANKGSCLALDAVTSGGARKTFYYCPDSAGALRMCTYEPDDTNNDCSQAPSAVTATPTLTPTLTPTITRTPTITPTVTP